MFYRLAQPAAAIHKLLFGFLRDAFKSSDVLAEDKKKLKKAVTNGACTLSEFRPYSALVHPKLAPRPKA